MTQESPTPSPELQERALKFLKEFCGLNENGVVGDSITTIMSHKGGEVGYWIIDSQGNKRRFKELLAAFAASLAPSIETARTRLKDFDDADHPAQQWWKKHGEYMLSGGGRREFIWACRGWIAREQFGEGVEVTGDALKEIAEAEASATPSPRPSTVEHLIRVAIDACDSFDAEDNHGSPHAKRVMDALRKAAEAIESRPIVSESRPLSP